MKLFKTTLILFVSTIFIGCGGGSSDNTTITQIPSNAKLASANIETASALLGKDYILNSNARSSNIEYVANIENKNNRISRSLKVTNGSVSGTKTKKFTTDTSTKTFTQEYDYSSYKNEYYDDVCEEYKTSELDGIINCNGAYSRVVDESYYFDNKTCTFTTDYYNKSTMHYKGGTKKYDYINDTFTKNRIWNYKGNKYSKQNWQYYYKKDEDTKTYQLYYISGKYYFDNLNKYIEVDTAFDHSSNTLKYDLCNDSIYNGISQFSTSNNVKMKFTTISTNTVLVEKSKDGIEWSTIGTFTRQ